MTLLTRISDVVWLAPLTAGAEVLDATVTAINQQLRVLHGEEVRPAAARAALIGLASAELEAEDRYRAGRADFLATVAQRHFARGPARVALFHVMSNLATAGIEFTSSVQLERLTQAAGWVVCERLGVPIGCGSDPEHVG